MAAAAVFSTNAETVSQKEASNIARLFFNASAGMITPAPKLVWNGKRLTTDRLFTPFYVYNNPGGGYVIISAENKTMPVLGFSLTENFDPSSLTKAENALLRNMARHIERIRYDSRVPEKAVKAWGGINEYISNLLLAPSDITDPRFAINEADEALQYVENADTQSGFSAIYTPSQWDSMLSDDFSEARSIALGILDGDIFYPSVITGKKGDYYNISSMDNGKTGEGKGIETHNNKMWLLFPTEFYSDGYIATLLRPIPIGEETDDEEPAFTLMTEMLEAMKTEQENTAREYLRNEARNRMVALLPQEPILKSIGGGRFQIILPEEARLSRVFSLSGAMLQEKYFKGSNTAFIDIAAEPSGFYILWIIDSTGRPWSFKIYR